MCWRDAVAARVIIAAVQGLTRALELLQDLPHLGRKFAETCDPHGGRKSASPGASPTPIRVASDPPTAARERRERLARAHARSKEEAYPKAAEGKAAAAKPGPTGDAAHHPSTHARRDPTGPAGGVAARQQRSGGVASAAEAAGDARSTAACQLEAVCSSAAPPREPGGESSVYESPPHLPTLALAPYARVRQLLCPLRYGASTARAPGQQWSRRRWPWSLSPLQPGEPLTQRGAKHAAKRQAAT